jgi:hypothetical protein
LFCGLAAELGASDCRYIIVVTGSKSNDGKIDPAFSFGAVAYRSIEWSSSSGYERHCNFTPLLFKSNPGIRLPQKLWVQTPAPGCP